MYVALWRSRYLLFSRYYPRAYQWAARRIIRAGVTRDMRRTLREVRTGALVPEAAEPRLKAYRQVLEM